MPKMRIREAATLLGVSDDTVRRWIDQGLLTATRDESGVKAIDGRTLADFARAQAEAQVQSGPDLLGVGSSARNRFVGLVTRVVSDNVMSQVEMQCGPYRVVSLMSTEAVNELGLEVGSIGVAVMKATTVIVETPGGSA